MGTSSKYLPSGKRRLELPGDLRTWPKFFVDLSDRRLVLLDLAWLQITQALIWLGGIRLTSNELRGGEHVSDDFLPRFECLDNLVGAVRPNRGHNVSLLVEVRQRTIWVRPVHGVDLLRPLTYAHMGLTCCAH
jgi:hypothetical protein